MYDKNSRSSFFILRAQQAFITLWQTFIKVLIFYHFDLDVLFVLTDVFGYAISRIISQLTLDNSSYCYPVFNFFAKIILVKTLYKIHYNKLLTIIEAFKKWYYDLKSCKYKVVVFIDLNNPCHFKHIKNLNSK